LQDEGDLSVKEMPCEKKYDKFFEVYLSEMVGIARAERLQMDNETEMSLTIFSSHFFLCM